MAFDYSNSGYAVRETFPEAYNAAWDIIRSPGNWWGANDRLAIAQEARNARSCALCAERKAALSPFAVDGDHDVSTNLTPAAIDAVHRIVTDPARLTCDYVQGLASSGVSDGHYVELLGVVVAMVSIDAFHRALGLPLEPLPEPVAGSPSKYRPPGARMHGAWVSTIQPVDLTEQEDDLYGGAPQTANVLSAMSLVPDSVRLLKILSDAQYMPARHVMNPESNYGRSISRPQIELLAGRVSSISDCFY